MAWHQTGDKPLSEPIMTLFADAYMHHLAPVSCSKLIYFSFILFSLFYLQVLIDVSHIFSLLSWFIHTTFMVSLFIQTSFVKAIQHGKIIWWCLVSYPRCQGHTHCIAVKATLDISGSPVEAPGNIQGNLTAMPWHVDGLWGLWFAFLFENRAQHIPLSYSPGK